MYIKPELKEIVDNLSAEDKDSLYRYLWLPYVTEDILYIAEDSFGYTIDEHEAEFYAEQYVRWGEYDCDLSYWTNLENIIKNYSKDYEERFK